MRFHIIRKVRYVLREPGNLKQIMPLHQEELRTADLKNRLRRCEINFSNRLLAHRRELSLTKRPGLSSTTKVVFLLKRKFTMLYTA